VNGYGGTVTTAHAACWKLIFEACVDCISIPAGMPMVCVGNIAHVCGDVPCGVEEKCPCDAAISITANLHLQVVDAGGAAGKDDFTTSPADQTVCAFVEPCKENCTPVFNLCIQDGDDVEWTCPDYKLIGNACGGGGA
jgi:hypothetical protein